MDKSTWDEIMKYGYCFQELDWVAIDSKGQVGVFTAIMNAPLPDKIKQSFENYKRVKEKIEFLNKRTTSTLITKENGKYDDWLNYADKGLFAFDFQDFHRKIVKNQYDLIAKPIRPIDVSELDLPIDIFVILECEFDKGDLSIEKLK